MSLRVSIVMQWTIPRPGPDTVAMFQNTNRNSYLFLQAAGIRRDSKEHKDLKKTIQALHRQYLHPFKYVEEQTSKANQLIASAHVYLPWLAKYEDGWPARIYLKRYVDTKRPHLNCSRHARAKQARILCKPSHKEYSKSAGNRIRRVPDTPPRDDDSVVREFLASLTPSLEHHLDALIRLGVKDQKTLEAFLTWPHATQTQFLDEPEVREALQLTSLEKRGLLLGVGQVVQKALERSLGAIVKPGGFPL